MMNGILHALRRVAAGLTLAATFAIPACAAPACAGDGFPCGTMTPLMPGSLRLPAVPDSLQPLYVTHIGRHGARWLSSARKVDGLAGALAQARAAGSLTADGEALDSLLRRVRQATAGRWGALDSLGETQQAGFARLLHGAYPEPFDSGATMAISSYVPRVVMSMYSFCHSLAEVNDGATVSTSESRRYSPLLRYFTTDPAYVAWLDSGAWRGIYDRHVEECVPAAPALRAVGEGSGLPPHRLRSLSLDMYAVLQSLPAAGIEADPWRWMTPAEAEACWQASNLRHCLQRTGALSPVPDAAAAALLDNIVADLRATAPAGEERPTGFVHLRFGHAETLLPLFDLMRLPGCHAASAADALCEGGAAPRWRDGEITPLGAFMAIVGLRAPSGRVWTLTILNGRAVAPLAWRGDTRLLVPAGELQEALAELSRQAVSAS